MRCTSCGVESAEDAEVCGACRAPLQSRCPRCGGANPRRFRFCGACGATLSDEPRTRESAPVTARGEPGTPSNAQPAERHGPEAERRQLTVLFCDLVGSTALAMRLDPEEYREVVQAYQRVCAEVIERFDGHIAQYLGDGLLVYFGYPQAHEDDGQRAARTALDMIEALARLNQHLERDRGVRLAVRVGIHTGLVVVGAIGAHGRHEHLAVGDTPNVAARLQNLAAPDTIAVSAATRRLIHRAFACQDLGIRAVEGISTPMQIFRVVREQDAQVSEDSAAGGGVTPLVDRENEVELLLERWGRAKQGQGQVVVLIGEAGIGKSRLVQVVKDHAASEPHVRVELRGSPYHQQSPLHPVIVHLQRLLGWRPEEAPEDKLAKLEAVLTRYGLPLPETVPLFASLLTLPLPERYPPLALSPQRQKDRTLENLLAWQLREAERQPMLLIIEDLHWLDPSTVEFLGLLVDQAATWRLLVLLTTRPGFRPPWAQGAHATQIPLSRLRREQAARMIQDVAGSKPLPAEVRDRLLDRTDGVPLFIEESTKMVLESGLLREADDRYELMGPLPMLAIPTTLHDSLVTRLDRLPLAKPVAQLAATIGRQFSFELLQAVSPLDKVVMREALEQLIDAELLYERGVVPPATYVFKHALIQQAAYQSLLRSTRQQYHQRIARTLVDQFPETAATQPELVAHHYTEAGLGLQAVPFWQRAGQRAMERSANLEAISHLTRGLELLRAHPETPDHLQQELTLQLALGAELLMIRGYPAPEVEQAFTRALDLCQRVGDSAQLFAAQAGLWGIYLTRPRLSVACDLAERAFALAQRLDDPALLQEAHLMLGASLFYLGDLVSARGHLEQGVALYKPAPSHEGVVRMGADPGARCLAWASWTLWILGYPDQAQVRMEAALSMGEEISHAFTRAWVLHFASTLHAWRRELEPARERAEQEIDLSKEQGFVPLAGRRHGATGLGPRDAGIARGRNCRDQSGRLHLAGARRGAGPDEHPGPAGGGVRGMGPRPGRARRADRGPRPRREERRALLRGRAPSPPRRDVPPVGARRGERLSGGARRAVISTGPRHGPAPAGEVPGAAGRIQPRSTLAATGQARGGPPAPGRRLRLVQRGVRHSGSPGRQSAARRPGVSRG